MNPRSTKRDCFPKGLRRILARVTSRPLFVAAIARMNPPMKSMMIGSAKQWRMSLYDTCVAMSAVLSPFSKNQKLLSEVAKRSSPTTAMEVVHAGIASKTHMRIANPKIAITLCWITPSPSIPYTEDGRHHNIISTAMAIASLIIREVSLSSRFCFFHS